MAYGHWLFVVLDLVPRSAGREPSQLRSKQFAGSVATSQRKDGASCTAMN